VSASKGWVTGVPPIDFANIFANLKGFSAGLKALAANGTAQKQYNGLTLSGTDPNLNVFAVDAKLFQGTTSITLNVTPASTTIINVGGAAIAIDYAGINVNGQDPGKILWNLYEATTFENKGMSFVGSVLAPFATANLQSGSMTGTLVAAAANVQSEMYFKPFRNNSLVQ
ncbi:MAG TPA: choice-of-anchor A family protein, partial [Polyangiaceae bacterium]|nr:choice-of-anchor A family protein [Polyangiaceae bacterium]